MWCVLYDLGCVLCCVYDLVWNLKTYFRNALNTGQVRLLTTSPILATEHEGDVCMCDRVCVCVIFGRIGLCGTVLLRHDVEVRDGQSLFPFSLSFSSLSLRTLAESTLNFGFA